MLLDPKTFDSQTSVPLAADLPVQLPRATRAAEAAAEAEEIRAQDKALAAMISHVIVLVLAVTFAGGAGLMAWALTSVVLAFGWVLYTTMAVPDASDL